MRLHVMTFLAIAGVLLIATVFSYFYEVKSVGLLPIIDYPLRFYALPILATGILFAALGIVLHLRVKRNE